jgi:hypothetical protein
MIDPVNPVLSGMMKAWGLHSQMTAAMQREQQEARLQRQEERAQQEYEQQRQVRDISMVDKLQQSGRPVRGGAVEVDYDIPARPDLMMFPGAKGSFLQPADKKRLVKYKDAKGEVHEYELFSPQEQRRVALEQAAAEARAKAEAESSARQVFLPSIGRPVDRSAIPFYTQGLRGQQDVQERSFREQENAKDRTAQEKVARIRASGSRAAGASAAKALNASQKMSYQSHLARLEKEEGGLHQELRTLGSLLQQGEKPDKAGNLVPLNALERKSTEAKMRGIKDRIRSISARKSELARTVGSKVGTDTYIQGLSAEERAVYDAVFPDSDR